MGERQEPLAMTVHLLANSGHGSLLQRTLAQLLDGIFPEACLFLVSERVSPVKSYEKKYHPKRSRFPGMSVLLFLHESLGEQRIVQVLNSLRHSPWQYYPTQNAQGRLHSSFLANQEFYSLDNQMPVWGVRQVHCGSEILRVTLYCSFDNYEDAIWLYEMILQKEATLQKSTFCFFVLRSTAGFTLQLALKQLPLGVSVDPKESAVLQFRVQEIGQLVPLLPHPCVPISSTRWQTQDCDGNTILLQVQMNPGRDARNGELFPVNSTSGADVLLQGSRPAPVPSKRTLEPRSRRSRVRSAKGGPQELPEPSGSLRVDSSRDTSWKSPTWASSVCSAAKDSQRCLPPPHVEPEVKMEVRLQGSLFPKLEAETNVDTGLTVLNSEPRQDSASRCPRDWHTSQPQSSWPSASPNNKAFEERARPLSLASQKGLSAWGMISKRPHHQPEQTEAKEEEEFFI
ncbi:protein FAM124B [Echinops telfairi]|uniref:Protein FAM124B n=1 Tax=Echinops telfairi TaxID=9371 RepID=A0ABM0IJZ8_ECHTE|nr:protein FAM124B [Echinops telfairi]